VLITLTCLSACADSNTPESTLSNQTVQESAPRFRVDPFWGSELPDNWILGEVAGLSVDDQDHVWVVHRPRTLDARQRGEEGMCCMPAPPVIEFSPSGSVLRSWGGPGHGFEWLENEHGIHVDYEDHIWIGGNGPSDAHILKFTADGEFLLQIGRAGQGIGSNDAENLGRPAAIEVDRQTNEVYVADGYRNQRLVVFDAMTSQYKRRWVAYGEQPIDFDPGPYTPASAAPTLQFRTPVHDVTLANDGLV